MKGVGHAFLSLYCSSCQSFLYLGPNPHSTNPAVISSILDYPPFNEIIHWDGVKRVVLEKPQILESYILTPVFGLPTLDVFKRRLYVCTSCGTGAPASDALTSYDSRYSALIPFRITPRAKLLTREQPHGVRGIFRIETVVQPLIHK